MFIFNQKKSYLGNIEHLFKTKKRFLCGLANLVYSSGFQNKVLEYANLRLPVITSREVSYGFQKKDRKLLKIYKSNEDLKEYIFQIIERKKNYKSRSFNFNSVSVGKFS